MDMQSSDTPLNASSGQMATSGSDKGRTVGVPPAPVRDYAMGLQAQPIEQLIQVSEPEGKSNGTRFQNVFSLTLTGILAFMFIFVATIFAIWLLPGAVLAVTAFAGGALALVGTFIGSQTGYLLGSSGKEHAEQRSDNLQNLLLKTISENSRGSKEK